MGFLYCFYGFFVSRKPLLFILRAFVQKCSCCCCCREKMRPKCIFSAQAINLLKCSWPDILLVPLIDGRGGKRKWFSSQLSSAPTSKQACKPPPTPTTYFRDVPCGRRTLLRRTTRQRHHPQLGSKLSYLALRYKPAMHMDAIYIHNMLYYLCTCNTIVPTSNFF